MVKRILFLGTNGDRLFHGQPCKAEAEAEASWTDGNNKAINCGLGGECALISAIPDVKETGLAKRWGL